MDELVALLARNGFVAADEEADELRAAAGGDERLLSSLVERRLTGEPLAWITGAVTVVVGLLTVLQVRGRTTVTT